jgi:hypothetical protein
MKKRTRVTLAASLVLAPLTFGIADQLRMQVMPAQDGEWGEAYIASMLENIAADSGRWIAVSTTFYVAAFLGLLATFTIWRLAVARAPRWAWTGVILGLLGFFGEAVHLAAHFATLGAFASSQDLATAAELYGTLEADPFAMALFVPFLLGMFAIVPQAIGLRRARVVPLWAVLLLVGGFLAVMFAGGSTPVATGVWTILATIGFTPAALAMLRGQGLEPTSASVAVPATGTHGDLAVPIG